MGGYRQVRRVVALIAGLTLLAGCSGGNDQVGSESGPQAGAQAGSQAGVDANPIAVTPEDGARDVPDDTKVTVTANGAPLSEVRVIDGKGTQLEGALTPDRVTWTAMAPLKVGTRYQVHAWADTEDGQQLERVTSFSTKDVERSGTLEVASVQPEDGATVGIGHPLQVTFNQPVTDRSTIQDALQVTTTPPVEGAWYWIDDVTVD
jgi:hypothetical protein